MKKIEYSHNIIKKRSLIITICGLLMFLVIIFFLYKIQIVDNKYYINKLSIKTSKVYVSKKAPRGNIYDRNGELLVGNKEKIILIYQKHPGISLKKELELIDIIIDEIDFSKEKVSSKDLVNYYYILNKSELESNLSNIIKNKYERRLITNEEYVQEIKKNITEEQINSFSDDEKIKAYLYNKMNSGFTYSTKTIKEELTKEEILFFNENNTILNGFSLSIKYERYYPFKNIFRSYLGNIGPIPEEDIQEYLDNGYNRNDIVGISYLEKQYEAQLKGTDETYKLLSNGDKIIVSKLEKGKDIYLSIDINLQKDVEKIVFEEAIKAKGEANTKYYNQSYVILSNPQTGEIVASVGQGIIKSGNKYKSVDYLTDLTNASITPGSIVKGASHLVGYDTGVIKIGTKMKDSCIKLKNVDKKCSWKNLGIINDLQALKQSSNYYQYMIAIKVGKGKYKYNQNLSIKESAFDTYRNMFNSLGLGVKTGIDLPYESIGYIGTDKSSLSLLSFPIGQYDTYTPMQLIQYINTIATSGQRKSLHFLYKYDESEYETKELNKVDVDKKFINRVQDGFRSVMNGGTGSSYVNKKYKASGKTGTAQNFIDTNNDDKNETMVITTTFGSYMPYNNPKLSIVVVSPNISDRKTSFISKINRRISKRVTDLYFKKYDK